jgi:cytochrome b involved in lipid metabolism
MPIKHANTQQHPVVYDCPCHRHLNPPTSSSSASSSVSTRKTTSTKPKVDRTRIIPRSELASRIINGENLVIYNDLVLDLTRWADKHPGGKLAVLHFVGRDATDEMDAYHSKKDLRRVGGFVVGRVDDREVSLLSSKRRVVFLHLPLEAGRLTYCS